MIRSIDSIWEGDDYTIELFDYLDRSIDRSSIVKYNGVEKRICYSKQNVVLHYCLANHFKDGKIVGVFGDYYHELWFKKGFIHRDRGPALILNRLDGTLKEFSWFKHGVYYEKIRNKVGDLWQVDYGHSFIWKADDSVEITAFFIPSEKQRIESLIKEFRNA